MPKRMWINQPSTCQQFHHLHGTNVLVIDDYPSSYSRVYFLSGDIISQQIPNLALSEGWKDAGAAKVGQ